MRAIHTIRTRLIQCCLDGQVELIRIKWPIEDRFQNCVFEPVCSRTVQERFLKIEIKNLKKNTTKYRNRKKPVLQDWALVCADAGRKAN